MSSAELMVVGRWLRRKRTGVSMFATMADITIRRAAPGDGPAFGAGYAERSVNLRKSLL